MLKKSIQKGDKYKPTSPKDWKRNKDKSTRVKGLGYVSTSGKQVQPKKFVKISQCCTSECFKLISSDIQKSIFKYSYYHQTKEAQETFLAGCIALKVDNKIKRLTEAPKVLRENECEYTLKNDGSKVKYYSYYVVLSLWACFKFLRQELGLYRER